MSTSPHLPAPLASGLPDFKNIKAEQILPTLKELIHELETQLQKLESDPKAKDWETLFEPLMDMEEKFHRTWSPVSHLHSVADTPELREAYKQAIPLVTDLSLKMNQSEAIYRKLKHMQSQSQWPQEKEVKHRIVSARLLDAELSGIALESQKKQQFNLLVKELRELESKFSNHVLDATKEFRFVIKERSQMLGLSESYLELSSQSYNQAFPSTNGSTADHGPWLITLDAPSFIPFLEYNEHRELRQKVYLAYISRASSGNYDNTPLITSILSLRLKMAQLLGYETFADLSLAKKMVGSVDDVFSFEEELRTASWETAKKEHQELQDFAQKHGFKGNLTQWDIAFWARKLQEDRFGFSEEELKPYFSLDQSLHGLFSIAHKIFGIEVQAAQTETWDENVLFFHILEQGKHIASFYLDPFSRPENKKGGAWMDDCMQRRVKQGKTTLPVAYLVCNFSKPTANHPSLLTFRDLETLFHEFGHGLQHMLTQVEYSSASGINGIEWDAVELPSQFMENWCYHKNTLVSFARHYKTGESIPSELIEKLQKAKTFRAASHMLRQIQLGLIDMLLHSDFDPEGQRSVFSIQRTIAEKTSVLQPLEQDRFLCSFSHIFAGGYSAGYYSYKWAEVLSADAFSAFEEAGLDDHNALASMGNKFRNTILAYGGGRHPLEVFKDFRGRAPSTQALLRSCGLS